ncbi:MAG: AAA family ATPase, partial [Methylophilaceae bacterium]
LRDRFPNFIQVIDLWEATAIGLSRVGLPFQSAPVLLVGDPGLGKTFFVKEAAKALALPYYELSMATATASFLISGGNLQWAQGEPGFVAKSLAESAMANPVLLLDEIDKVGGENRYDPLGPFYPLLEPHSAKRFRDEALEVELDASKVIWVATANDINNIPSPIRSRMRVFEITPPDPPQMRQVIKSVYQGILDNQTYGSLLDAEIHEDAIEVLSRLGPRLVRQSLEEASLHVIRDNRSLIQAGDIKVHQERRTPYGFL